MALSKEEIESRLAKVLSELSIDRAKLDENRLTSLQIVELLMVLEKEFQFEIDPTDYEANAFSNHQNLVLFIERQLLRA